MQTVKFLVPGKGDETMWKNIGNKRGPGLAAKFEDACPGVQVDKLITNLAGWTYANPRKGKRDLGRFVWNAAVKEQDQPKRSPVNDAYRHGGDLADKIQHTRRGGSR